MGTDNLITSKDLIERTGISRATLNNYIKLGILPKPIVRRPGPEQKGVKQIGYFPASVFENILKVKLLKQQGSTMDEIADLFRAGSQEELEETSASEVEDNFRLDDAKPAAHVSLEKPTHPSAPEPEAETAAAPPVEVKPAAAEDRQARPEPAPLRVTIADISSPAYLVNHNFEIEWINGPAEQLIFNHDIRALVDAESRNIFRLLFDEKLRQEQNSWKDSLLLHLTILQNRISGASLDSLYDGVTDTEREILADLFARKNSYSPDSIYHIPVNLIKSDNTSTSYQVHTMSFREGTFFVYVPTDSVNTDLLNMLSHRDKIINELMRHRMPSLATFCVLIADLQDSVKISAELLPAHYFELINELWQTVGPTFDKYKGIYGKHAGDGMLYYFLQRPGVNYLTNVINCAIEIREVMKELSSKWKLRKGWDNELYLNTGINEGQEFFGTIHSSNNIEFTALGDTINIAARLSDFARNGSIWTTKNLISRLSQEERSMIRFGVHQENKAGRSFIRNSFSRIGDIASQETLQYRQLAAIAGLPITEIKEKVYSPPAP